jgi:hypothetical protein
LQPICASRASGEPAPNKPPSCNGRTLMKGSYARRSQRFGRFEKPGIGRSFPEHRASEKNRPMRNVPCTAARGILPAFTRIWPYRFHKCGQWRRTFSDRGCAGGTGIRWY